MIYSLQSMRAIAIFVIFLNHLSFLKETAYGDYYEKWIYGGNFGVSFFFLLSGFVLAFKYYEQITNFNFKDSTRFTYSRIKKFYPLHLVTTLVFVPNYFISYFANPFVEIPLFLSNIFLLKSYIPLDIAYFSYNAASWFLSTLLPLYLVTPFVLCQLQKLFKDIRWEKTTLTLMMLLLYLCGAIMIFINPFDNQFTKWFFYISPFFRAIDFGIGILCGILSRSLKLYFNRSSLSHKVLFTLLELIAILLFFIVYVNRFEVSKYFRYGLYWIPLLVVIVLIFSCEQGLFSRMLKNRALLFIASISFQFFLVHNILVWSLGKSIGQSWPILTVILVFSLSLFLSVFLKKYFNEKNGFLIWKRFKVNI